MHIYSYMAEICKKYAIAELSSHGGRCRTGVRRRSASALSLLRDRHLPPAARRPPEFACGLSSVFRLRNDRNPAPAAAIRSQPVSASPGRSTFSPLTLSGFESRAAHKKNNGNRKTIPAALALQGMPPHFVRRPSSQHSCLGLRGGRTSPGRSTFSPLTLSGFESRAAHKKTTETVKRFPLLARCKGFEPLTFWFVAKHSIQLS